MSYSNGLNSTRRIIVWCMIMAMAILLVACTPSDVEPDATAIETPFTSPLNVQNPFVSPLQEPVITNDSSIDDGRAVVKGRLWSSITNQPITNAVVRLAEIYYGTKEQEEQKTGGVFALDNAFSPSTFSDDQGYFTFTDVEARDYVVLVGDVLGDWALGLDDSKEKPKVWTAVEQSVTDIGEIYLDYE